MHSLENPFTEKPLVPGMVEFTRELLGEKKAEAYIKSQEKSPIKPKTPLSKGDRGGFQLDLTPEEQASLAQQEKFDELQIKEMKRLREFFGHHINVPAPSKEITPERLRKWEAMGYELQYWPKITMDENKDFPGWEHKPGKRNNSKGYGLEFYDELQNIQNLPENKNSPNLKGLSPIDLPGAWVLKDARPKPNYQNGYQQYENDSLMQNKLKELVAQGIVNQEASSGLRNRINPNVFQKPEFWQAIAELLGVDKIKGATVRLPRAIEANVMGQGEGFHDTSTHEWNEEYYRSGERLGSGYSGDGGASCVRWGDGPSGLVGFRLLVIFR